MPGTTSIWMDTTPATTYSPLERDTEVDVCVIGGGITGITTAVLLRRRGCRWPSSSSTASAPA